MPNKTTNYGLTKPLSSEFYDIQVQNENMDIIDRELKNRASLNEQGKVPEEQLPDITNIPVTSEVPADSDIWIDPDDETTEASHITDKNNPHGVTAAQVGAAKSDLSNASGTLGGQVVANATAAATLGTPQIRNVTISPTDLTAGSSSLATGSSYHVYG